MAEQKPINTILLWITIGALGFIGTISYSTAINMAKLEGSQMTRGEIEAKLAEVRTKQSSIEKDIFQMKIDFAKIAPPSKNP